MSVKRKPLTVHPQLDQLKTILRSFNVPFEVEYKFHPVRKWRLDLAIPSLLIGIEYQGHAGLRGGKASGHSTISGLTTDCEKSNQAIKLGWRILTFTALHFREAERVKNKLESPYDTIRAILESP